MRLQMFLEAPNNAVVTEGTSSQEPPCSEPAPALTLLTTTAEVSPALDKKDPSSYSFPSMRVEDISDKEDSDSVATLSADEGPTLPPEDNKDMVQVFEIVSLIQSWEAFDWWHCFVIKTNI